MLSGALRRDTRTRQSHYQGGNHSGIRTEGRRGGGEMHERKWRPLATLDKCKGRPACNQIPVSKCK